MQYAQSSGQPCTWLSDSPDLRYSTTSRVRTGNASIWSLVSNSTNVVTAPPTDVVAGIGTAIANDAAKRGGLVVAGCGWLGREPKGRYSSTAAVTSLWSDRRRSRSSGMWIL